MNLRAVVTNQEGSVLVVSIMILALLTVIGIAATTTTSIELQIAANERIFKENFYAAEGAALVLAQVLENTVEGDPDKLRESPPQIPDPSGGGDKTLPVKDTANDIDVEDILKDTYWEGTQDKSCEVSAIMDTDAPRSIVRYIGMAPGASLDMTGGTNLRAYSIFARRKHSNSTVVVELGYKNRL